MKRFVAVAVVVGLLLAAIALHAPRRVKAENPPQYKVEITSNLTADSVENLLNRRASEGWYLRSVVTIGDKTEYIFTNVSPQH